MSLKFLNQLTESQIIDLLNYTYKGTTEHIINHVQISNEPDRCDAEGNQQVLVNAWDNGFHVGMYTIQDFTMNVFFSSDIPVQKLREYLTSIFGEEYLNGLREYYAMEAEKEIEKIQNALGKGRS